MIDVMQNIPEVCTNSLFDDGIFKMFTTHNELLDLGSPYRRHFLNDNEYNIESKSKNLPVRIIFVFEVNLQLSEPISTRPWMCINFTFKTILALGLHINIPPGFTVIL